jgi:hypothetical protein
MVVFMEYLKGLMGVRCIGHGRITGGWLLEFLMAC